MVRTHASTPAQRAQWSSQLLAHSGEYGLVSRLSRESGVSRPTLYAWREQARRALVGTFTPVAPVPAITPALEQHVLTLWSAAHASTRGIQTCLRTLSGQGVSLETITAILREAEQRAVAWMTTHMPADRRALALDEIYAHDRRGAYLNAVDVHSGAVWGSDGPLPVDTESWTLVLWDLHERGLRWDRVVKDAGGAMAAACRVVTPQLRTQQDQWHLLHTCTQVQDRLERQVQAQAERTPAVARQAARVAAGQRPLGRAPQTDVAAHVAEVTRARRVAENVAYLSQELHRLLDVVVVDRRGVLDPAPRQADLDTLLTLLAEVGDSAPAPQQALVQRLHTTLSAALPEALTFVPAVARVQQDLRTVLPPARQELLAWAWLRRRALQWTSADILAAVPLDWRAAAAVLLHTWDDAVRVSSAVERWHSILRPHLAVHRTLSTGRLALLAVWHNHRVFTRGVHKGQTPLHLSGISDAPTDWLVALGYVPPAAPEPLCHAPSTRTLAA